MPLVGVLEATTMTTSGLIQVATDIMGGVVTQVTTVTDAIVSNPFILFWCMFPICGIAVGLVKRLTSV